MYPLHVLVNACAFWLDTHPLTTLVKASDCDCYRLHIRTAFNRTPLHCLWPAYMQTFMLWVHHLYILRSQGSHSSFITSMYFAV